MRSMVAVLVAAVALACGIPGAPQTDITRQSTETAASTATYHVVGHRVENGRLILQLQVDSVRRGEAIARRLIDRRRDAYEHVRVDIFGPGARIPDSPDAFLEWTPAEGYAYREP